MKKPTIFFGLIRSARKPKLTELDCTIQLYNFKNSVGRIDFKSLKVAQSKRIKY